MKPRIGVFNIINDVPLKFKFLMIYILCVLLPMLIINLVFLDNISNMIREREENNLEISYNRAKTDIIRAVESCIAVASSISTDRALHEEIDRRYKDENEYYEAYYGSLRDKLTRYITIYNNISDLRIYTKNTTIVNGGSYYRINDEIMNKEWYNRAKSSINKVLVFAYKEKRDPPVENKEPAGAIVDHAQEMREHIEHTENRYNQYLSIFRVMNEYGTFNSTEKILRIDIDMSIFKETLKREQEYMDLYLVDNRGKIVCAANPKYEEDTNMDIIGFDTVEYDKDSILLDNNLGDARFFRGWRLVGIANKEVVFKPVRQSMHYIFILMAVIALISTILVWIIVRSYNYRIHKLSKHMSKSGNQQLDLLELSEGKDEIGELIRSFNRMASKINTLINDVYKLQIQKKNLELERVRAEINFLQSQMNPHFLFNTLNAILVVSVKNEYTGIVDVIRYLSKTLRRLLSWKEDLVTVREEVEFTEMYLKIEKFRFGEKFEYSFSIQEEAVNIRIPKMSIQPLAENACKHGVQSIKECGKVDIKIRFQDGTLQVAVEDNGGGMPEYKLDEIIFNMTDEDNDAGVNIGIRNVYRRLKLYYGEGAQIYIDSKLDTGTKVMLLIPVDKRIISDARGVSDDKDIACG